MKDYYDLIKELKAKACIKEHIKTYLDPYKKFLRKYKKYDLIREALQYCRELHKLYTIELERYFTQQSSEYILLSIFNYDFKSTGIVSDERLRELAKSYLLKNLHDVASRLNTILNAFPLSEVLKLLLENRRYMLRFSADQKYNVVYKYDIEFLKLLSKIKEENPVVIQLLDSLHSFLMTPVIKDEFLKKYPEHYEKLKELFESIKQIRKKFVNVFGAYESLKRRKQGFDMHMYI